MSIQSFLPNQVTYLQKKYNANFPSPILSLLVVMGLIVGSLLYIYDVYTRMIPLVTSIVACGARINKRLHPKSFCLL